MKRPARTKPGRRDFLKLAAGAAVVGAPWIVRKVEAKPATIVAGLTAGAVKG